MISCYACCFQIWVQILSETFLCKLLSVTRNQWAAPNMQNPPTWPSRQSRVNSSRIDSILYFLYLYNSILTQILYIFPYPLLQVLPQLKLLISAKYSMCHQYAQLQTLAYKRPVTASMVPEPYLSLQVFPLLKNGSILLSMRTNVYWAMYCTHLHTFVDNPLEIKQKHTGR